MKRSELAALLAQTHPSIRQDAEHSPLRRSPNRQPLSTEHSSPSSPLSPRQQLQSRIRTLSDDTVTLRSSPERQRLPPVRLQHVSSLRVQPQMLNSTHERPLPTNRHSDSAVRSLRQVTGEPDFILEERKAWSTQLPDQPLDKSIDGCEEYMLDSSQDESPQQVFEPDLRPFAPSSTVPELDARPKTSRGPSLESLPSGLIKSEASNYDMRKSRFVEGSMNDRSVATASTWVAPLAESYDARTSLESQQSNLSDVADFKPAFQTPTTFRQRLFRRGNNLKLSDEPEPSVPVHQPERKSKGLRKAISTWNFQTLGGKMKIFGVSGSESTEKAIDPVDSQLAVLTDRKRKAEEAYAEQFGLKKQKPNSGPPVANSIQPSSSIRRRSMSITRGDASTMSRRNRRASSAGSAPIPDEPPTTATNGDRHKRLSRRDLEMENQQLRALLREHEKQVALPAAVKPELAPTFPILAIPDTTLPQDIKVTSPEKKSRLKTKTLPPVPSVPEKFVLGNGRNSNRGAAPSDAKKKAFGLPRPVSMILELDEGDENKRPVQGRRKLAEYEKKEKWEWPEDVF